MKRTVLALLVITFIIGDTTVFAERIQWGFKRGQNEKQADAGPMYEALLEKYDGLYMGDSKEKVVYLTFDSGYEYGYTEKILDVLKAEGVPATFFVTGHYLNSAEDLVKRMVKEGHIIGNHSWHHPDFSAVSDERIREELQKVKDRTAELTGQTTMEYLRPPRGVLNERSVRIAKEEGYYHVMWSLAYTDWYVDKQKGPDFAYQQIMKQLHPGAVILLHSVSKDNADVLERVIRDVRAKGYQFKSLDYHYGKSEPFDQIFMSGA
ncbi:delta-lactam-biosynthetic de-N-acetylase [Bacillus coahuilensis]|uniref:delta-lactam-biosynthetic de-N-acetylase n=1 Tax=Bacillus coahuilensis TaxID=408580 RepID=UPI0007511CEB|nr:delta-lactam-biosynthetic de-N-acetylase [Bacillus coahuilensis]